MNPINAQTVAIVLVAWLNAAVVVAPAAGADVADAYIQGYAAAVLQEKHGVSAPSLRVQDGVITLAASEVASADRSQVVVDLRRIRGVTGVALQAAPLPAAPPPAAPGPPPEDGRAPTGPLPGGTLFAPLIADPRWPHFSMGYHGYVGDPDFGNVAAVSLGETFTLYRGALGPDRWEVGLQGGVFSIFDLDAASSDLINADYFAAVLLGYRHDALSAIARVFHQSSHLGDEFLLRRSRVNRINLSYEGLDAKISYELASGALRLYAGGAYLVHRDPPDLDPGSLQYGLEVRSPWPGPDARIHPIAAVDVQHREQNGWAADLSVRAGVQFDGEVPGRNLQLLLEYFNGRSPNGQFYRREIDYIGLGAHVHF